MHYHRRRRNGELPMLPKSSMEERFWAKVEKSDGCWYWTGAKNDGYGHFTSGGKTCLSHRYSYELVNGPVPDGLVIDHICGNRACVKPDDLRPATHKQNQEHRFGAAKISTSGIRGVIRRGGSWGAYVTHRRKLHWIGSFSSPEAAERAVIAKRNELFTHNDVDRNVS